MHIVYEDEYISVTHAIYEATGQVVVIRQAKEGPELDAENEKLIREFQLLQTLDMPGVLHTHTMLTRNGAVALVSDNINSLTLRHYMAIHPVTPESFLRIALGIATVVEGLHARGILHRNLRPEAILVNEETLSVCITGFSDAVVEGRRIEHAGPQRGSPAYMAPERTRRGDVPIDARSDMYSLGITFYEMLAGRLPFQASGPVEWAHAHMAVRPDDLTLAHGVAEDIGRLVMPLLAKQPSERSMTAAELRGALGALLREEPAAYESSDVVYARTGKSGTRNDGDEAAGTLHGSVEAIRRMPIRQTLHATEERTYAQLLDLTTVLKASQAFMESEEPDALVRRLLRLVMQYAGADKLIWIDYGAGSEGTLIYEAGADGAERDAPAPLRQASDRCCVEWVERVARGNHRVSSDDASADPFWSAHPYVRSGGVRSVSALPVPFQGALGAVLYLENNAATGVFREVETKVLRMLLSQTMYIMRLMGAPETKPSALPSGSAPLTLRELAVLDLISIGLSNKEIASKLTVSAETVKAHVKNIFDKLDVNRRAQAVMEAKKLNLL
ncbi:protein kinase [Paenibacillus sp. TRM 82003]|nr:protein kinase [Paenibacillus sp. TRM 82003]